MMTMIAELLLRMWIMTMIVVKSYDEKVASVFNGRRACQGALLWDIV